MKIQIIKQKDTWLLLSLLVITSFVIRIHFSSFTVPLTLDALEFFLISNAINNEGYFPVGYTQTNIGWSTFLSFFLNFKELTMIDLMNIQKILSISISSLTVIPIFFLIKKFFKDKIAIFSSTLFIFDPKIIVNSTLGIADSLYIILIILILLFLYVKNQKFVFVSYMLVAIISFVRYEGLLLIIPVIIGHWIISHNKTDYKKNLILGIFVFLLIFIPYDFVNFQVTDIDAVDRTIVSSQYFWRGQFINETVINNQNDYDDRYFSSEKNNLVVFIENSISGFIKFLSWGLIPNFFIFFIIAIVVFKKKISKSKIIFAIFISFISIPALYGYGRGFEENRYILFLLPVLTIFSSIGAEYLYKNRKKWIFPVVFFSILIFSFIFVDNGKKDWEYENDLFNASLKITKIASGVNDFEGNRYIKTAEMYNNWPNLEYIPKNNFGKSDTIIKKFETRYNESISEYISKNNKLGLSHILVFQKDSHPYFQDVYNNEKNYPYLEKIFDSEIENIKTKYKIFKIIN